MRSTEFQNDTTSIKIPFTPPGEACAASITEAPRCRQRSDYRSRERAAPVLVEATVHWWRSDERRGNCAPNQFGVMPTTPVRFRCIGSLTPKFPRRYRIDLAQALDWLPELTQRELKGLGASLVEAVAIKMGVYVAPLNCDILDLTNPDAP